MAGRIPRRRIPDQAIRTVLTWRRSMVVSKEDGRMAGLIMRMSSTPRMRTRTQRQE